MQKVCVADIDGVACAHAKAICQQVNKEFSICAKEEDIKTWDHSFGKITFIEAVNKYYPDIKFIMEMEVTKGFLDFLENIKKKGVKVIFASARKHNQGVTEEWVKNNFGQQKVFFIKNKAELDFDYLVDDNPDEVIEASKKGMAFLLAKPWNNNEEIKNRLKNIKNSIFVNDFTEIFLYL
jgi:5'(3')-deoxyribonucleotidase